MKYLNQRLIVLTICKHLEAAEEAPTKADELDELSHALMGACDLIQGIRDALKTSEQSTKV